MVRLQGLFFLALHPRPEFPTRELQALINKLLSRWRNFYNVAYTFTDTKLDVEFFYKGTTTPIVAYTFTDTKLDVEFFTKGITTPVSSFTRVQQLPTHYVFWGLKY